MSNIGLGPIFAQPELIYSDASCRIDGDFYPNAPLLVDRFGRIVWPVTSWFRKMLIDNNSPLTVEKYSHSLCLFWRFLQRHRDQKAVEWTQVNDTILRRWRSSLSKRKGRSGKIDQSTINAHLEAVISFYRWAQEFQFCFDVIGETQPSRSPFPIRLVKRRSRKRIVLTSDLLYRIFRKPRRPIPTRMEVQQLYIQLGGPHATNIRDCLMCRWAIGSGLRASEILSLSLDCLPSESKCNEALDSGKVLWLDVVGKNRKKRSVPVLPDVVLETYDYIDTARHDLLSNVGDHSSRALFIGARTGKTLSRIVFSRTISQAFHRIGNRDLTLHRLRARFASLLVQELRKEEMDRAGLAGYREETVLERAAEILGHCTIATLRYYLNLDLDKSDVATKTAMSMSLASFSDVDLGKALHGNLSDAGDDVGTRTARAASLDSAL
jgi:site-specific recombinase XerD